MHTMGRRPVGRGRGVVRVACCIAAAVFLAGCDWTMFGNGSAHTGYNASENAISVSNVSTLTKKFATNSGNNAVPAVAGGFVYSNDGLSLSVLDAAGSNGCSGTPRHCAPLWTAAFGTIPDLTSSSSPAVANGFVYVGSGDGGLYAFDANGVNGCSGSPKHCAPRWVGTTGADVQSAPSVSNGVVYVGASDKKLYAFDANGVTGCSGAPKTCAPLWTATTGNAIETSPAVANGVVYVAALDGKLYAFDAKGQTGCSGAPKTCNPLWSATLGSPAATPAVANGVVFVGDQGGKFFAFDAAGVQHCSGAPKHCSPLWTATMPAHIGAYPAIANNVVYVGSTDGTLSAFDARGITHCAGAPVICQPLWTAHQSSPLGVPVAPAVANGVVYSAIADVQNVGGELGAVGHVTAFDANGTTGCAGAPKVCTPLWTSPTVVSNTRGPVIANGTVYTGGGNLTAFALPTKTS